MLMGCWRATQLWTNSAQGFEGRTKEQLRTYPLIVFSGAVVVLLFMLLGASGDMNIIFRTTIAALVVLVMISTSLLWILIRYRGRPDRLIPPHLRAQSGRRE